jgi:hypothetical protein
LPPAYEDDRQEFYVLCFSELFEFSGQQHTSEKDGEAMLHVILLKPLAGIAPRAAIIVVFEIIARRTMRQLRYA